MNKGDLRKVERYLHRDLEYLMREGKILVDLKKDVEKIKGLLEQAKESKRARLLLAYYTRDAGKEERLSERIERRINAWIERLERLLSDRFIWEGKKDDKDKINQLKEHIDICKNNLARLLAWNGELHTAIQGEDWETAETKIDEAMGSRTSPGVRSLMVILEHMEKVEETNRKLIELDDPFKMLRALKGNPHLAEVTEFMDRLDPLILEGDYSLDEILKLIEKICEIDSLRSHDFVFNLKLPYLWWSLLLKMLYILFEVNKNPKRISKELDQEQFDLSNSGKKAGIIRFSLLNLNSGIYDIEIIQIIKKILQQKETIYEIRLDGNSYLSLDRSGFLEYNGQVVLAFFIYLIKSKNLPELTRKFLIYCFLNIDEVLMYYDFKKFKRVVITEKRDLFVNGLVEMDLFKNLVVSEIGGNLYTQSWTRFGKYDLLEANPTHCGINQCGAPAKGLQPPHQSVRPGERIELSTWKEFYPLPADFSLSARVMSLGSGMTYGGHPDLYCAMELLACFASMTKNGGYSIHYFEHMTEITNPLLLNFLGFELVEYVGQIIVLKKLNNNKVTKKQFERWFYANLEPNKRNRGDYVFKNKQ